MAKERDEETRVKNRRATEIKATNLEEKEEKNLGEKSVKYFVDLFESLFLEFFRLDRNFQHLIGISRSP